MLLSILIPTVVGREEYLKRLLSILLPQKTDDVEIIIEKDDGSLSIGEKRNILMSKAKGDYVSYVDDDDRVSTDYVQEILKGIEKTVDIVSIQGELTTNGQQVHKFIDKPYRAWIRTPDGTYIRGVQHLDAIKRSIASQFKFEHINFLEDQRWGQAIEKSKLITSYHQVEKPIYFYDYRNDKTQSYSVIIPSANAENLMACMKGLLTCERGILPNKIIVVDDGARNWSEGSLPRIKWVTGEKPFVFARNINAGIKYTDENDSVILLNDDAIIRNLGGFTALVKAAEGYGIVSAATNLVGNPNQVYRGVTGIRPEGRTLAFIAVCIPRFVLNTVGLLDERFTAYGFEDNDFCLRARICGVKLGVFDGCFVDHMNHRNTFVRDCKEGQRIFNEKWGVTNGLPFMPRVK